MRENIAIISKVSIEMVDSLIVFQSEDQSLADWVKDKYGYSSAFYSISDITVGMGLVEINQVRVQFMVSKSVS